MPAQYAAADYQAALDRAGRSEHTRRAHASRVAGYLGWLAGADLADDQAVGDPTGADPLADAWARDFAVRDYRVWLLTMAKKAPNTVNAHLTAVDAFSTHRGLGPANADRVDLPQQTPRALEEAELRRVLRGAERLPSTRDKTTVRTLYYSGCAPPSSVDRGRRRHRHLHHPAQTVAPAGEGLPRFMTTRAGEYFLHPRHPGAAMDRRRPMRDPAQSRPSPTLYDPRRSPGSSPGGTAATSPAAMVQSGPGISRAAVEWSDVLELQGLTRRYGELVALDDLSFTVAEGQMFGFVGPNGAGTTTAMRIILGVLEPDAGEVRWRGQPMTVEMRKHLGYLPEDHGQTFPSLVRLPACHRHAGNAGTTLQ